MSEEKRGIRREGEKMKDGEREREVEIGIEKEKFKILGNFEEEGERGGSAENEGDRERAEKSISSLLHIPPSTYIYYP